MLNRKILRHGAKPVKALNAVVKDQFFPESSAVGSAEKSVMFILGDIHHNNKNRLRSTDGVTQLSKLLDLQKINIFLDGDNIECPLAFPLIASDGVGHGRADKIDLPGAGFTTGHRREDNQPVRFTTVVTQYRTGAVNPADAVEGRGLHKEDVVPDVTRLIDNRDIDADIFQIFVGQVVVHHQPGVQKLPAQG